VCVCMGVSGVAMQCWGQGMSARQSDTQRTCPWKLATRVCRGNAQDVVDAQDVVRVDGRGRGAARVHSWAGDPHGRHLVFACQSCVKVRALLVWRARLASLAVCATQCAGVCAGLAQACRRRGKAAHATHQRNAAVCSRRIRRPSGVITHVSLATVCGGGGARTGTGQGSVFARLVARQPPFDHLTHLIKKATMCAEQSNTRRRARRAGRLVVRASTCQARERGDAQKGEHVGVWGEGGGEVLNPSRALKIK